jgi:nitronate monooxygenase
MMAPPAFAWALAQAQRRAPGRPLAANLIVPFITRGHIQACVEGSVSLVVLYGGMSLRWLHRLRQQGVAVFVTVGTAREAQRALAGGADGLVAQGSEAGGHLLGVEPLRLALARVLSAAEGRMLFGLGWPLRHRVIPNAATERWCRTDELGPHVIRAANRLSAPLGRAMPLDALGRLVLMQRPGLPLFTPALPLAGMPAHTVDATALYAGETVRRLHDVISAEEAVARLTPV